MAWQVCTKTCMRCNTFCDPYSGCHALQLVCWISWHGGCKQFKPTSGSGRQFHHNNHTGCRVSIGLLCIWTAPEHLNQVCT